jgi:hypothetical protein
MSNALRILDEQRIDLEGVRPLLGTPDNPASTPTVRRATHVGARTPDGGRVRLEYLKTGLKVITSIEAVERYLAAINGIPVEPSAAPTAPAPARTKRRQRELASIDAKLDALGI